MPERSAKDATGQKRSWTSLRMSAINTLCPVRPGMPWFCSLTFLLLLLRTDLTVPSIPSVGWEPGCACGTAHCSSTTPYNDGRDPLVDPLPAWVKGDRPTTHTPGPHSDVLGSPPSHRHTQTNKQTNSRSLYPSLGIEGGDPTYGSIGTVPTDPKGEETEGNDGKTHVERKSKGGLRMGQPEEPSNAPSTRSARRKGGYVDG